jgi:hypothetical protein
MYRLYTQIDLKAMLFQISKPTAIAVFGPISLVATLYEPIETRHVCKTA